MWKRMAESPGKRREEKWVMWGCKGKESQEKVSLERGGFLKKLRLAQGQHRAEKSSFSSEQPTGGRPSLHCASLSPQPYACILCPDGIRGLSACQENCPVCSPGFFTLGFGGPCHSALWILGCSEGLQIPCYTSSPGWLMITVRNEHYTWHR